MVRLLLWTGSVLFGQVSLRTTVDSMELHHLGPHLRLDAQDLLVLVVVAGARNYVMHTRAGVLNDGQDGPPPGGDHDIPWLHRPENHR